MFLAPSSSRAVDPYLQTLLLRVSLSRLDGKHQQRGAAAKEKERVESGDTPTSDGLLLVGTTERDPVVGRPLPPARRPPQVARRLLSYEKRSSDVNDR